MMKFKYLIIMLFMMFILPVGVLADGSVSVSTSKINITKGGSSSFVVTANNSAGRIDITSSNPGVVSVSQESLFLDMQSSTIVVSGKSVGSAIITVYVSDVTTYDDEDLSGKSYTISVNVSEPVNNNTNNNVNKNLSDNNNVKSITVEGYELNKINEKEFNLSVMNNVTSVNIKTVLEDDKASVSGDGLRELKVGSNVIEIIITSESGKQNKYVLNITRKDGYHLEDLTSIIGDLAQKDINVKIEADSILSSDILKKIKDSGKQVSLNYSDENNKLIYSWLINGNNIEDTNDFLTSVSYISEYKDDIEKLTNYADGLYINIKNNNKLPNGSMIKLNVGDKFDNGEIVKLYCYNPKDNKLNFVTDEIAVKEKYIQFNVNDCSNYFITMSTIKNTGNKSNLFLVIGISLIVVVCLLLFILLRKRFNKRDNNINNSTDNKVNDLDNIKNTLNEVSINNDVSNVANLSNVDEIFNVDNIETNETINNSADIIENNIIEDNNSFITNNFDIESEQIDLNIKNNVDMVNNEDDNINEEVVDNDVVNSNYTDVVVNNSEQNNFVYPIEDNSNIKEENNVSLNNIISDNDINNGLDDVKTPDSEVSIDNECDNMVTFGGYNIDLKDDNGNNN